jgi:hypothetical protein
VKAKKSSCSSDRVQQIRSLSLAGIDQLHRALMNVDVPYIPMGEYWQSTAHREDLLGVQPVASRSSMASAELKAIVANVH